MGQHSLSIAGPLCQQAKSGLLAPGFVLSSGEAQLCCANRGSVALLCQPGKRSFVMPSRKVPFCFHFTEMFFTNYRGFS